MADTIHGIEEVAGPDTLVLGIGNTLLSDEGVGVRVIEHMDSEVTLPPGVELMDGGTMGLGLLPSMEDARNLIVVDAARLNAETGTVRLFVGTDMDAFLKARGRTPHDVGLDDLMDALRIRDRLPANRALIGIQPEDLSVGNTLSEAVAAAIPEAATQTVDLTGRWAQK